MRIPGCSSPSSMVRVFRLRCVLNFPFCLTSPSSCPPSSRSAASGRVRFASLSPVRRLFFAILGVRVRLQARQPVLRDWRLCFSHLFARVIRLGSVPLVSSGVLDRRRSSVHCFERGVFGDFVLCAVVFSGLYRRERLASCCLRRRSGVCGCFEPAGPYFLRFMPLRRCVRVWPPGVSL